MFVPMRGREHLHAVVAPVCDEHLALGARGDAPAPLELSRLGPGASDTSFQPAIRVEHGDAVTPCIGDPCPTPVIYGDAVRAQ